jgi:hypothetical protein
MMKNRIELANELASGTVCELGVARGNFSQVLLDNPNCSTVYSIDRWSDHHDEDEYKFVLKRFKKYGDRSIVVRSSFSNALQLFNKPIFNFIYVDGYAHTGQEEGRTFACWWEKLLPGGIFAGHDYCLKYKKTMDSVHKFINDKDLDLSVTSEDKYNSWYVKKGPA